MIKVYKWKTFGGGQFYPKSLVNKGKNHKNLAIDSFCGFYFGFTLIELLAVIIVLAIIALIATPIIFNIIENAKLKALENSCYGVIDAIKTQYAENLLNSEDGKVALSGNAEDLNLSGEHPYWGTWEIDNSSDSIDRGVKIKNIKFSSMKNYSCSNDLTTGKVTCIKDGEDNTTPTITAKQTTVTIIKGTNQKIKKYFDATFGVTGGEVICETENTSSLSKGNYTIKCIATGTNGLTNEASISLIVKALYVDNSGANYPTLYNNMVPIKYINNKWVVADLYEKWYDYDSKEWANAVVLNTGTTKETGDEITEDDIALWYVWIPRYKYTIFNGNNGSASEQLINVTFETETNSTGTVTCTDNFEQDGRSEICTDTINGSVINGTSTYTHPAFTFGNTDLKGFWVGKFEVSTTDSTCNSNPSKDNCNKVSTIKVIPNVSSWRYTQVANFFISIQNIKTEYEISNADSHMIKNMEWGAVAYLKQSKYGLGTTDIGINNNSSYITGCGAATGSSKSEICNAYDTEIGMLASTTGNIYGVYDMSGGSWEYVMGNMLNSSNNFYSSSAGFLNSLDSKYYDTYKYDTSNKTHARGKLGDATKETLLTFGSTSGGWYSDYAVFPHSNYSWFQRGGRYTGNSNTGLFGFSEDAGGCSYFNSTRAILTVQ